MSEEDVLRIVKNGVFAFRFEDPTRRARVDPEHAPSFQILLEELNAAEGEERPKPSLLLVLLWALICWPVAAVLCLRAKLQAKRAFQRTAEAVNAACERAEKRLSPSYAFQRFGPDLFSYAAHRRIWTLVLLRRRGLGSCPATPVKSAKSYRLWSEGEEAATLDDSLRA